MELNAVEKEKLVEWFAECYTVSEVKELYTATFGKPISNRLLMQIRNELQAEIQDKRKEEYETSKMLLSPEGIMIALRKLILDALHSDRKNSKYLADLSSLLRLAKEVWELEHKLEQERLTEQERMERFLRELLTETEKNKELLAVAEQTGLLRFQQLQIGGGE